VLSDAEIEEIEAHVPYYRSEMEPIKRVFFTTATGESVVTHIVPLAEADQHGRKGRYLAHSLVFTPKAFAHLGADPFWVFRHFPFITTVEEALAHGDFQTGDMPAATLQVAAQQEQPADIARRWSTQELQKLTLLALRADKLARDRQAVAMVGEPQQVESALEAAFFAVPTHWRPRCTFDTYFYKCNFVGTYYWAIGELEPPSNPLFTLVDVQSHQVAGSSIGEPETAYECWVVYMLRHNNLEAIAAHRDQAYALCAWLDGQTDDDTLIDTTPLEVVLSVFQVNAQQVQALLRRKLSAQLPPVLVTRLFEPLYDQTEPIVLFRQLQQGFALSQLLQTLYQVYETLGFREPPREELQALGTMLQHTEHRALALVHACWTRQRKQLYQGLESLSEDEYRRFVQTALRGGLVEPLACLIPGKGEAFLEVYLASGAVREQSLGAVVQAVLEAGESASLPRLMSYLPGQSARELRLIEKTLDKRPEVPEPFKRTVSEAIAALPPARRGLRGLLHTWLGYGQVSRESDDKMAH
jgi:hypothetical protein